MEGFLNKLLDALRTAKPIIVTIIGIIAIIQITMSSLLGGEDRRKTIVNVVGLVVLAGLIAWSDGLFRWIVTVFGS
jgi:hypothetical protein